VGKPQDSLDAAEVCAGVRASISTHHELTAQWIAQVDLHPQSRLAAGW
jgi:hypothetical protein